MDASDQDEGRELVEQSTLSDALKDPKQRELLGLEEDETAAMRVVVELNLLHKAESAARTRRSWTSTRSSSTWTQTA